MPGVKRRAECPADAVAIRGMTGGCSRSHNFCGSFMPTATLKWFNDAKGFALIMPEDGREDLFAHVSAIQLDPCKTLKQGQKVNFEATQGTKGKQAPGHPVCSLNRRFRGAGLVRGSKTAGIRSAAGSGRNSFKEKLESGRRRQACGRSLLSCALTGARWRAG